MKKLIRGIIAFRETRREGYAETFRKLALGQKPDALFVACSDSRMAVNVFASTDPGDLFVVRNVGNLVPPYGHPVAQGTAAAVDFAVEQLGVADIIVCGHSDCGAMHAHCQGADRLPKGPLRTWLEAGATAPTGTDVSEASRRNVLAQLDHLAEYPSVVRAVASRRLRLHGIWFDIPRMDVLYYEQTALRWCLLDAEEGERILARLDSSS